MISEISSFISEEGAPALATILGEDSKIVGILSTNPLLIPIITILLMIVLFAIFLFVDFIKDAWKMPFGILLDLLAIILIVKGGWIVLLFAFVSAGVFFMLSLSQKLWRWIYTVIGFLKFFILLPFIPIPDGIKMLILFIPLCTIAMFFVCITD